MTLTISTCKDHVRAVLGGDPLSVYSGAFIVNTVGRWLEAAHPWEWLARATTTLDVVGGQSWIALPALRSVTKIVPTGTLTSSFRWVSIEDIVRMRESSVGAGIVTYGALNYHAVSDSAPVLRLEVWPTPDTSTVGAYTLHYKAAWSEVTNDNATIPIPAYMEHLFLLACIEFAKGMEEYASEDQRGGSGYDRLERLRQTFIFQSAAVRDGVSQPSLGRLQNGAGEQGRGGYDWMDFPVFGDWS